jgi:hypothetical protein
MTGVRPSAQRPFTATGSSRVAAFAAAWLASCRASPKAATSPPLGDVAFQPAPHWRHRSNPGRRDRNIRWWAQTAASVRRPFLVRFDWQGE